MPSNPISTSGDPPTPIPTHMQIAPTNPLYLFFTYSCSFAFIRGQMFCRPSQKHKRPAMFPRLSLKSGIIPIRKTCIFRLPQVSNTFVKMDLQDSATSGTGMR